MEVVLSLEEALSFEAELSLGRLLTCEFSLSAEEFSSGLDSVDPAEEVSLSLGSLSPSLLTEGLDDAGSDEEVSASEDGVI